MKCSDKLRVVHMNSLNIEKMVKHHHEVLLTKIVQSDVWISVVRVESCVYCVSGTVGVGWVDTNTSVNILTLACEGT